MIGCKKYLKWMRLQVLFPFLALLPMRWSYYFAAQIGRYDAGKDASRCALEQGLLKVYPNLGNDRKHLDRLVLRYFQMMAKDTLDCLLFPRFTATTIGDLIHIVNLDVLTRARNAGKGVILIVGHFGRTFMLMPGLGLSDHEVGFLYTAVDEKNPSIDPTELKYLRTKLQNGRLFSNSTWVTTYDNPRKIYRALHSGEIFTIAFDGTETSSKLRLEFEFLGGTLSLPKSILRVAAKTGAKLVFATAFDKEMGVEIILQPLPDEPYAAMCEAVRLLEQDVITYPWQWRLWSGIDMLWHSR